MQACSHGGSEMGVCCSWCVVDPSSMSSSALSLFTHRLFQSLLDGLKDVDADLWRDVINLQMNWIGDCDGVRFDFQLLVCNIIARWLSLLPVTASH